MKKRIRRPSLKKSFFDFEEDFDLESLTKPYQTFKEELKQHAYFIKNRNKGKNKKAYVITCVNDNTIFYIAFATYKTRDGAKNEAFKYFENEVFHPRFIGKDRFNMYHLLRRNRCAMFDKYAEEGKVPITEILRLGVTMPCCFCGKHNFTREDFEKKRCFYVESEGDLNVYTKGLLACYECFKKLSE